MHLQLKPQQGFSQNVVADPKIRRMNKGPSPGKTLLRKTFDTLCESLVVQRGRCWCGDELR